MTHPGDPVHPAPHTTLLLESSELRHPVVAGQDPARGCGLPARTPPPGITTAEPTTADSKSLRRIVPRGQTRRLRRARASTCPAETFPAARASCTPPGKSAHTAASRAAPSASRVERPPPPVKRVEGGSQAPSSARREACRARAYVEGVQPGHEPAATSTRAGHPGCRSQQAGSASANSATSATTPGRAWAWRMALTPVGLYVVSGGGTTRTMEVDFPGTWQAFEEWFPDDEACRVFLARVRWPDGFRCPSCDWTEAWVTGRGLWMCRRCGRQTSVTAGTIFHRSHYPLRVWFAAMWFRVHPEERGLRARCATGARLRFVSHGVDVDAQVASGDGPPRLRPSRRT